MVQLLAIPGWGERSFGSLTASPSKRLLMIRCSGTPVTNPGSRLSGSARLLIRKTCSCAPLHPGTPSVAVSARTITEILSIRCIVPLLLRSSGRVGLELLVSSATPTLALAVLILRFQRGHDGRVGQRGGVPEDA